MARVEIFQPKTDAFAQNLAFKKVKVLVRAITFEAKIRASTYTGNSVPEPDGGLARSIHSNVGRKGRWKVVGSVGSNHPKALLVHNGSPIHVIAPVRAGGLKFYWREKGRFVCIKSPVTHPGFKGKYYLTYPLRIRGHSQGFRTVISTESGRTFS